MSEPTNAEVVAKLGEVLAAIQSGADVASQVATIQSMLVSMASQQTKEPEAPVYVEPEVIRQTVTQPAPQPLPNPIPAQPSLSDGFNVLGGLLSEVLNRLDQIEAKIDGIQIPDQKEGLA